MIVISWQSPHSSFFLGEVVMDLEVALVLPRDDNRRLFCFERFEITGVSSLLSPGIMM